MIPGIDPKVDIAFKKLFGSEQHRNLTMSLIDAVLDSPPWQRLVDLELLNPYTQQMAIDDKLSVLDIKARDDQGRLFNVEMQMAVHRALPERLLYYWARLHTQQLTRGNDYQQLCPTISICFVNSRLFPPSKAYHRHFRLRDTPDGQTLTGHLQVHVLEIPNFRRTLADLQKPLDFWLYFLKNGEELDADALPEPLDTGEMRQVMEVLKVYSQDQMEREIYEGRLKAEHDAATWERTRRETEKQQAEIKQSTAKAALAGQVQLCERLLGRAVTDWNQLVANDEQALQALSMQLERLLTGAK